MAKKVKKVDLKKVAKVELSKAIANALIEAGFTVDGEHTKYGFTEGTLVVSMENTDVQVKLITPKTDLVRYAVQEDEAEQSRHMIDAHSNLYKYII